MKKHDENYWREECNYISRVCDKNGKVKEMNNDTAVFRRYCEMQQNQARKEGYGDVVQYIQHCIDDLPMTKNPRKRKNPAEIHVDINSHNMRANPQPLRFTLKNPKKRRVVKTIQGVTRAIGAEKAYNYNNRTIRKVVHRVATARDNAGGYYCVQVKRKEKWITLGCFIARETAIDYGKSLSRRYPSRVFRIAR